MVFDGDGQSCTGIRLNATAKRNRLKRPSSFDSTNFEPVPKTKPIAASLILLDISMKEFENLKERDPNLIDTIENHQLNN